jgi:hypothetical protein
VIAQWIRHVTPLGSLALGLMLVPTPIAAQEIPDVSVRQLATRGAEAQPPLPSPSEFPVQLVQDDNSPESVFGVGAVQARQFMWFQQFGTPTANFTLDEIWVLFPSDPEIAAGASVQLVVYRDPDGDPTDGANLLWSSDEVIQAADGITFSVYPVTPALEFQGAGDVLIGVVNRFVTSGVSPMSLPAVLDTNSGDGRSWVATWDGDPSDPPILPGDQSQFPIDDLVSGTWMIRGFGQGDAAPVPTLNSGMVILLTAAIAAIGVAVMRWRR